MIRQFSTLFLLVLLTSAASGATIYVAQTATGDGSGSSTSNRKAITTINSSWGLSAGDTLSLGGTLTTSLIIGGSGTAGNPITILFESGAKFSAPTWPNTVNTGGIISGGGSYIVIDGGSNGLIEATDNGWQKTYSNNFCAVNLTTGSGMEIKNLTIINLNPRLSNIVDNVCAPQAIRVGGAMTNLFIHNNNITNVGNGIVVYPETGISTNIQVYSNNVFGCSWGIYCESASDGAMEYGTRIWRNRIDNGLGWDAISPGPFHNDGIIVGIPNLSSNINMKIYWNIIGPDVGYVTTTSAIYFETTKSAIYNQNGLIFDNVLLVNPGQKWNSGIISINGSGMRVYNNTFGLNVTASNPASQCAIDVAGGDGATSPFLVNNLISGVDVAFYLATISTANVTPTNGLSKMDFNYIAFGIGEDKNHGFGVPGANSTIDWTSWHNEFGFAGDTNNTIIYSDPTYTGQYPAPALLDNNGYFAPLTNDTMVVGHGTNLTALADALEVPELKLDINGNPRPPTGPWTIGAFQTAGTASILQTVSPPSIISIGPGPAAP
jgi:hypothetical protein